MPYPHLYPGRAEPLSKAGFQQALDILQVPAAKLWAILAVESRGTGFLRDRRPKILFERHKFWDATDGKYASRPHICNPESGGYKGGAREYPRLEEAASLNLPAALESTSWGLGQVMGFNHEKVSYPSVEAFVKAMAASEDNQLLASVRYLALDSDVVTALRKAQWAVVARYYNGKGYARNQYDLRLKAAARQFAAVAPDLQVRALQLALWFQGFEPGLIDGFAGRRTRSAAAEFQEARNLATQDGSLTTATANLLREETWPTQA